MCRRSLPLLALLALPVAAAAQPLSPAEAVKRMQVPPGFTVRCVASEPMIRQPVSISFDARGRMWVLQYLQYPNYAGLKPVKQDQYLRTIWDKVPEPPPHGPNGLDRLTILSDPDENGVYRQSKDFATGLNIASGFCLGRGGVYVVQPPYLLFYPDRNEDDVPDGDPEVLLAGFGMDDTHSLANSLQWGPDGWLYGAAGSTSTCKITNPADPKAAPVEFQQGLWRFHPKTRQFELFSEGGGNTYGLDFDRHGQAIAGTNWGGFAMLHQMQGAYYVKGFAKHGPLHNPHTYGYFDHVPYTGFKGGHVTCGGIVYQADAFPAEYRDQYIAANLLSNAVYWHKLERVGSSFKASHGGDLLVANDPWFRPIDVLQGPDGSVFVVDFYDRRAAHLDPVDNWDKTNGRVYKIEYQGTPKQPPFDLRKKPTAELVEQLKHPNKWWRTEARRVLAERQDKAAHGPLRKWVFTEKGDLALEALWTLYASGGWMERDYDYVGPHANEHVRAWAVRFLGDDGQLSEITMEQLRKVATGDTSPVVLAQLACTARRLPPEQAMDLMSSLMDNPLVSQDAQLPLLVWWAMESANTRDRADTVRFPYPQPPNDTLRDFFGERVARRFMAGDVPRGETRCATLIELTRGANADMAPVLRGMAASLQAKPLDAVPPPLLGPLTTYWKEKPKDFLVLEVLARMNHEPARAALRTMLADGKEADASRVKAADLLRQVRDPHAKDVLLAQLAAAKSDALRLGLLAGLEGYDDPAIGATVLGGYASYSPAVKKRAIQTLLARPAWAMLLLKQLDAGKFPKADFTLDHARAAVGLNDKELTSLVEKHYGKLAPATAGEKQARIAALNLNLSRLPAGDPAKGKPLFVKHCAACHTLHGEGGKAGPDLTTADRKNRMYMLTNVVDPSGYIRPEFVVHNVTTLDGRKLSGIVAEPGAGSVTLVNVVNDQPVKTVVAKGDIEVMVPSAVSLMPEKLLDSLTDFEIADLLAYLASDPASAKGPVANAPGSPAVQKKLKVAMISGSFEYKSDESLARLKRFFESTYGLDCTIVSVKNDKDKSLPGLEVLDTCDVAIFFTRRLQLEGESLERVKKYALSGKPLIGVRTASHGFQNWLDMDKLVLGGNYQGHFGQNIDCAVTVAEKGKGHPVLKGVAPFKTTGGLYKNPNVSPDVTVLLTGTIAGQPAQPVAWVREKDGRRVFYTSLGTPDDFSNDNFLVMLVNAVSWTTKTDLKPVK